MYLCIYVLQCLCIYVLRAKRTLVFALMFFTCLCIYVSRNDEAMLKLALWRINEQFWVCGTFGVDFECNSYIVTTRRILAFTFMFFVFCDLCILYYVMYYVLMLTRVRAENSLLVIKR